MSDTTRIAFLEEDEKGVDDEDMAFIEEWRKPEQQCHREEDARRAPEIRVGARLIAESTGRSKALTEAAMRNALKRPPLKSDAPFQIITSSDRE